MTSNNVVAAEHCLRACGLCLDDFEVSEHDDGDLSIEGTVIAVRRRWTHTERFYSTEPGVAWSQCLLLDIQTGCFGPLTNALTTA